MREYSKYTFKKNILTAPGLKKKEIIKRRK